MTARGVRRGGSRAGMTLIELLTVMTVIGILAGIAVPTFRTSVARADAARVVADVRAVRMAAAQYISQHDALPPSGDWGDVPDEFRPYLPDGFAFGYKGLEYAWAVVDGGTGGAVSAAAPEIQVWGYSVVSALPVAALLQGQSQGKGKGQGKGQDTGGGEDTGGSAPATGDDPVGDTGGPGSQLTGRVGVLWVRYAADDPIAGALQRHAGSWAFWTETQMMFVLAG